ncbi:MAG: SRPBCC family protein [Sphingomonadales bacterium]|nr:SRPBCC family protein [Sphingomonadales bacterium]
MADAPTRKTRDDAPPTAAKDLHADRALLAEAVTIAAPRADLYRFWRDPANLASIMENVVRIEPIYGKRSRWTVKAPGGRTVSWESVITHEVPDAEVGWQSVAGAEIDNSGRIEFRDAGPRGTVVRAVIAYDPPGGLIGQTIARLFQREPRVQARRDLHRLKQLFEAGEIATGARNRRLRQERNEDQRP